MVFLWLPLSDINPHLSHSRIETWENNVFVNANSDKIGWYAIMFICKEKEEKETSMLMLASDMIGKWSMKQLFKNANH